MDAKITCEFLLKQLKSTNLNFILQETPYSVYLTIRKSFIKNLNTNNPSQTFNVSEETLNKKIADLEAENWLLKSNIFGHRSEMTNSEQTIIKLEEKIKTAEIETIKNIQETKKVEKQFHRLEDILVEKEKEIMKLRTISKNLNDDVVKTKENLQNVSKSLKVSEKESFKAKNKCDNLESTITKLKAEQCSLQKTIKKFEKSEKKKTLEEMKSKTKQFKDLETSKAKDDESEEADTADPIAYNIPVFRNPFELLDEKKDRLVENNNIKSENDSDFDKNSKDVIEKEENSEPFEKKSKIMSPEQELRVLKQIEEIMLGTWDKLTLFFPHKGQHH